MNRTMPHNLELEENVLGAMLSRSQAVAEALEVLNADDFYRDQHRVIYSVLVDLYATSRPTDYAALADELKRRGQLEAVGDRAYLVALYGSCPNPYSVKYYAERVRDLAIRRELVNASYKIADLGYSTEGELDTQLAEAEGQLYEVGARLRNESIGHITVPLADSLERMEKARQKGGRVTGLATGFNELDGLTCGLQPSNLIIVGGRTSMGKTSFALNIAHYAAVQQGLPVLVFSLEMVKIEVAERLILAEALIDSNRYRAGNLTNEEVQRARAAAKKIGAAPIIVDDEGDRSLNEIRSISRRLVSAEGVRLIVVDYIQLLYGDSRKHENRAQEVSRIARSLKVMAMELGVPVIAVSQLRRPAPTVSRKEPQMEDLKESGGIEQNADLVILLYRPEVDHPGNLDLAGVAEVNLAKHRNGRTGKLKLVWVGSYSSFMDPDRAFDMEGVSQ